MAKRKAKKREVTVGLSLKALLITLAVLFGLIALLLARNARTEALPYSVLPSAQTYHTEFLDDNSYRGILKRMEESIRRLETLNQQTAENTRKIAEKLGAK